MKEFTLIVKDSYFGKEKAKVLHDVLSRSGIKVFIFQNYNLAGLDYDNNEFSHFEQNVAPIKMLPNMSADLIWINSGMS